VVGLRPGHRRRLRGGAALIADRRPVLFVTNHVPPDRAGAFRALHERVGIELALFGGRSHHATQGLADPGVPHRRVTQREVLGLAAAGGHRAVVCGTAGRAALPAAWVGARRAGVPFVLWSALWAHPRSVAHLAGALLLRALYRDADAVVAYGEHVAAFARAHGARPVVVAPQAVDGAFWGAPLDAPPQPPAPFTAAFVGRDAPGKGLGVLLEAWRRSGLGPPGARLALAGVDDAEGRGVRALGALAPAEVRNLLASSAVVVVPSVRTRTFREPWGLVVNEAMHRSLPVIATTEVGAVAGGLVRHEDNGLVVPAGDPDSLAGALRRLDADPGLRRRLGAAGRTAVAAHTFDAWAQGFAGALSLAS
jgi:glycosyltransferase involved in cell wall biosynthesis